ncbi:hypothetical protein FHS77_003252 [Paenochrobactrum gallinarii]|uniref:Uncharacterized protein n=1 Tax=Paenochrobactrum gallinarii TaxID=643673 RepID=A0A841M0X6_9HYPH|nr:hypothetical protein [Paenochrobactrum gallinarii]
MIILIINIHQTKFDENFAPHALFTS